MAKKIIIILLFFLLSYLFVFSESGYIRRARFKHQIKKLEAEIELIQEENRRLTQLIERLKNDPYYIEMYARKYGMMKEGEALIIFKKPSLVQESRP